jgi:DNA replication protein DnaC
MLASFKDVIKCNTYHKTDKLIDYINSIGLCKKCHTQPHIIIMDFAYLIPEGFKVKRDNIYILPKLNRPKKPIPEWGTSIILDCKCKSGKEPDSEETELKNRISKNKIKATIPEEFTESSFKSWDSKKYTGADNLLELAEEYVQNFEAYKQDGKGILIYSNTCGNGKSLFCSMVGNELLSRNYKVKFIVVPELLQDIKNTFNQEFSTTAESEILKEVYRNDLVIFDDIGVEKWTDWVEEKIFLIINYLYNNKIPFLMTSNLTMEQLLTQLGEKKRIISRIVKRCMPVENKGFDCRLDEAISNLRN